MERTTKFAKNCNFAGLFLALCTVIYTHSTVAAEALEPQRSENTLCFFSLNNPEEFSEAKEFFKDKSLKVIELLPQAEYPIVAFQKAIQEAHCDGLVLSGHHRKQGFEGDRVPGYLPTHEILALSCAENNMEWFRSIKHLWLQGCATGISQKRNVPVFADTFRSIFPNASVYTWSGSAPSKVAPKTIPFQFENYRRLLSGASEDESSEAEGQPWSAVISSFFQSELKDQGKAWTKLRYSKRDRWKGIYNHGAKTFPPFNASTANQNARNAVCDLANARGTEQTRKVFNQLLSNRDLTKRFLPLLLEHVRNSRDRGDVFALENPPLGISKAAIQNLSAIYKNDTGNPLTRLRAGNLAGFLKLDNFYIESVSRTIAENALLEISSLSYRWDSVEQKHYRWETFRELFLSSKDHGRRIFTPVDTKHISGSDSLIAMLKTLIEINPENIPGFLVMVSKHDDFSATVRRYIMPLLALISPLERKAIKQKIKEIQSLRSRERIPAERSEESLPN